MRTNAHTTAFLGDLVAGAFDIAAQYSTDPQVVSLLATRAVMRVLERAPQMSPCRHVAGPLLMGRLGDLLAVEASGRQPRGLALEGGVGAAR